MKTEHRHELKTNELGKLAARVKPFLDKYMNYIIIGACVALVVGAGIFFWSRTTSSTALAATSKIAVAGTASDFGDIADEYPNLPLGNWARLLEAENHLFVGIRLSFTDRSAALSELEEARESFEKVLEDKRVSSNAEERALFGLARTIETLSGDDTSEAIQAYERLLHQVDDTVYLKIARERISDLKDVKSRQFYSWYQAQNPKPLDLEAPRDGSDGDDSDGNDSKSGDEDKATSEDKSSEDNSSGSKSPGDKSSDNKSAEKESTEKESTEKESPNQKSPGDDSSRGNKAPAKSKAGKKKTSVPKPGKKKKTGSAGDVSKSK